MKHGNTGLTEESGQLFLEDVLRAVRMCLERPRLSSTSSASSSSSFTSARPVDSSTPQRRLYKEMDQDHSASIDEDMRYIE